MYELIFSGSADHANFPKYKREHKTLDSMRRELARVDAWFANHYNGDAPEDAIGCNPMVYVRGQEDAQAARPFLAAQEGK